MAQERDKDVNIESDESDAASDGEEKEFEKRTEELESQLSQNIYLYDAHVELVGLYRRLADLNSMRAAYERFHKHFPITPTLWLDWIHDEIKLASSKEEKKNVLNLFDKAVEDYQSVQLWQEYAQFAIGACNLDETRSVIERGLNAGGLHVSQGSLLWDTLRELELAHLSLAEVDTDQFSIQLQRVVEVYRRQLSVPLLDMEDTLKEWKDFFQQLPDDHGIDTKPIEWGYKKANQLLKSYKPYEQNLIAAKDDAELYKVYKEYINFVKDPSLAVSLYEQAVAQLCLNVSLWEDYCYYTIKLGDISLKVSERALRNCTWYATLWVARMRILEMQKSPEKEMMTCFEEAIKSVPFTQTLDIWLTYIEYIKRSNTDLEHFDKLCTQAKEQLTKEGDPTSKILRYQGNLHARAGDMNTARKLWSEIMHNSITKTSVDAWTECIALEKQFGDSQQVRQLYQRAIANCKDWQQYFANEWTAYEREIGSLEDVLKCFNKCKKMVTVITEHHSATVKDNPKKRSFDEQTDVRNKYKKQRVDNYKPSNKLGCKPNDEDREAMDIDHSSTKMLNIPADIDPEKTVFLSNFVPKVTEKVLKDLFPNAIKISIPTDRKGKSRCYAYVQFETSTEASEALKKDREPLDGRPLFVSKCQKDRNQRQTAFKYSQTYETNKLFVKGLPKHYSKESIEEIFKPYKSIDVRLVTKFNGQFKGLAYIDFANDEDAALALKNTDQMVLDEHTITVAISAPPTKKNDLIPMETKLYTRNSRTKLSIPLIPRSVQVKQTPSEAPSITKTNEDFRKLLLNK